MQQPTEKTDVLIIGAGASGLMAGIASAESSKVIICEKMKKPGLKILASGGERCNVTNTLDHDTYMEHFGRHGRFMSTALRQMGNTTLIDFFSKIGIDTKSRDGFRVFPASHKSQTVLEGLLGEYYRRGGELHLEQEVIDIKNEGISWVVTTKSKTYHSKKLIIATGGLTYPALGTTGDGYKFAESLGHTTSPRYPGGVPLRTKETWPKSCRADTIGKALLYVDIKKHRKISKVGDIIFTNYGIAGPVVLDLSRQITPLVEEYGEVPMGLHLRPSMNQQNWQDLFNDAKKTGKAGSSIESILETSLPKSVVNALAEQIQVDAKDKLSSVSSQKLMEFCQILSKTPLTVTGSMGYRLAFVTKGGVKLKEINPETLESKINKNLHFCGEVVDLDGPCGGYNLQWAFASGYLAGSSIYGDTP